MDKCTEVNRLYIKAHRLKLEGAERLDRYSLRDLARIYNGVGPAWLPAEFRQRLSEWLKIFLPAVLIHDVEYDEGGSYDDFCAANDRLEANCVTLGRDAHPWWSWRRYASYRAASLMAELCRKYGAAAWRGDA